MTALSSTLSGRIQHMAESDLMSMIPTATLAAIRAIDPHPHFRAYCIAHEGEAAGTLVGFGKAVIQYFRDVVSRIYDRLTTGTPIFRGHNADNSHGGRQAIGQVVGKGRRTIEGRDSVLAAVYVAPEHRAERLDVCSVEANIVFTDDGSGHGRAVGVEQITGVALGNSETDTPGFPGATLLAALQAFVKTKEATMTKEEIIQGIKDLKLGPGDLFSAELLREDKAVAKLLEEETEKERGFGSRQAAKVEKLQQKLSEQEAEFAKQLKNTQGEATRAKSRGVLDTLVAERKLDDTQKKFVERYWDRFQTEATDEKGLKGDLNRFLDAQLAEHRSLAADVYGVKTDGTGNDAGTPSGDGNPSFGPGNNPLIPV